LSKLTDGVVEKYLSEEEEKTDDFWRKVILVSTFFKEGCIADDLNICMAGKN